MCREGRWEQIVVEGRPVLILPVGLEARRADRCKVVLRGGVDQLEPVSPRVALDVGHNHLHGLKGKRGILELKVGAERKEHMLIAVTVAWLHLRDSCRDDAGCELDSAAVAVSSAFGCATAVATRWASSTVGLSERNGGSLLALGTPSFLRQGEGIATGVVEHDVAKHVDLRLV